MIGFLVLSISISTIISLKNLINKSRRNISEKVARDISTKSIYRLECKLKSVCERYSTKLHIIEESYTSLTCSNCMHMKRKEELKCKRKYECLHCNQKMDRDYNAAKNIMLRYEGLFSRIL